MKKVLVLTAMSLAVFAGCKSREAVQVDISKICSPDNEKKYVTTSGYLDDRGSVFCSNIGGGRMDCGFDVIAAPGGTRVFGGDIEEGSGANKIEKLESGYKREDIKIHDNNGNIIKLSDKVTLTGEMSIAPDGSVCFMEVDKIER
jgi:hypothetical protein